MEIERIWSMPNRWTFDIDPIRKLILEEKTRGTWIDPFAGHNEFAQITNDLNPDAPAQNHMDALDFLKMQQDDSMDGAFFDPPYSPRQVSECYKSVGRKVDGTTTQASFWSLLKDEIMRIVKPSGKVICCGWNSMGMGASRGFKMTRILMVPHGGNHNDTIVTVEIKTVRSLCQFR
jgi:hypothetical protein